MSKDSSGRPTMSFNWPKNSTLTRTSKWYQTGGTTVPFRYNLPRMLQNETRFRVRYAETDQMGVVYYANYLIWMELGRVEYCRSIGLRYKDMEVNDGIFLTVAEANCRYLSPARYDEEI